MHGELATDSGSELMSRSSAAEDMSDLDTAPETEDLAGHAQHAQHARAPAEPDMQACLRCARAGCLPAGGARTSAGALGPGAERGPSVRAAQRPRAG